MRQELRGKFHQAEMFLTLTENSFIVILLGLNSAHLQRNLHSTLSRDIEPSCYKFV